MHHYHLLTPDLARSLEPYLVSTDSLSGTPFYNIPEIYYHCQFPQPSPPQPQFNDTNNNNTNNHNVLSNNNLNNYRPFNYIPFHSDVFAAGMTVFTMMVGFSPLSLTQAIKINSQQQQQQQQQQQRLHLSQQQQQQEQGQQQFNSIPDCLFGVWLCYHYLENIHLISQALAQQLPQQHHNPLLQRSILDLAYEHSFPQQLQWLQSAIVSFASNFIALATKLDAALLAHINNNTNNNNNNKNNIDNNINNNQNHNNNNQGLPVLLGFLWHYFSPFYRCYQILKDTPISTLIDQAQGDGIIDQFIEFVLASFSTTKSIFAMYLLQFFDDITPAPNGFHTQVTCVNAISQLVGTYQHCAAMIDRMVHPIGQNNLPKRQIQRLQQRQQSQHGPQQQGQDLVGVFFERASSKEIVSNYLQLTKREYEQVRNNAAAAALVG